MSYALLWIETLLASLLFAAMLITLGLRRKTKKAGIPLCAIGLVVPMIPLGGLLAFTITLRFVSGMRSHGLWWAVTLVVLYLFGAITSLVIGKRRDAAGVRRVFVWPLARMSAAWLMVVSLMAMTLWNLDLRAQVEIQALRAEAGAIALSVTPPMIPDSANATLVYKQATDQFNAATIPADKDVDYIDLDPKSPVVQDYLRRQAKTLELLRRAADMPECRVDFDYSKPDVSKMLAQWPHRGAMRLLDIAARVEAATGNIELAVADARRSFAAADHTGSTPALIGGLAAMGNQAWACKTAEKVLPAIRTEAQLDAFGSLDSGSLPHAFAQCLGSEQALGLALFCDMADGSGAYASSMSRIGGHTMWLAYLRDEIIPRYRKVLRQAQQIAEKPFYQTSEARRQFVREGKKGGILTVSAIPSLLPSFESLAHAQALRSSVVVALAATRYRLDHGDYPAAVGGLISKYIATLPLDPFDGQPLRMKKLADGSLVIYSVGPDLKDDGGDVESDDEKHKPADVGISLKLLPAKSVVPVK